MPEATDQEIPAETETVVIPEETKTPEVIETVVEETSTPEVTETIVEDTTTPETRKPSRTGLAHRM